MPVAVLLTIKWNSNAAWFITLSFTQYGPSRSECGVIRRMSMRFEINKEVFLVCNGAERTTVS